MIPKKVAPMSDKEHALKYAFTQTELVPTASCHYKTIRFNKKNQQNYQNQLENLFAP